MGSFNNRLRKECLNRNHWNSRFEAQVVIGDFKHEHNHRHRLRPWATARRSSTPAAYVHYPNRLQRRGAN